ncbi:segregation/condensation protein A [Neolewinella lacunae]|uniref:Segregation and condensation protein A n=1 Tax=Neolewinella lacunae TaxID=1517758 RepID=A0A923PLV9_9BACT|nr:segregation/condensation protein A [Neolewinella lacunae]MBC6995819.1 segregation/condensation protein A [Neolewinella lacunae]MDN3636488.1 segregation/condensation protein A [Neolewinella lacunae]
MAAGYTIKLPQFEGPFDLLLFFIERDELDIYDIPIAKVTDDFLDYMRQAEAMDIDLASEFVLVAATLCRIKAKILIPRKAVDEQGNEIDPREELVSRLLEYKRYKSVLEELRTLETERGMRNYRGNITDELAQIAVRALVDVELESVTLFKLLKAYESLLGKLEEASKRPVVHEIAQFSHTIEEQQIRIMEMVSAVRFGKARPSFADLFSVCKTRIHAIVTFLGLLELLNAREISIVPGEGLNNFWLEPAGGESGSEEE